MYYIDENDIDFEVAAEPEVKMQIKRELNLARKIIEETSANLFLTGKAGTGKTTFLRHLRDTLKKRMVVLAPTGVAAINAKGQTIHSFFQFPFSYFIPGKGFVGENKKYSFNVWKRRLIRSLDLLVIDEISMVRPDMMDAIDDILQRIRGNSQPFGGVQLLLIGDLRQLAPVIKDYEWAELRQFYTTPYFFDSLALKRAGMLTVELVNVYRQSDRKFIDILNAVRDGSATIDTLNEINKRYRPDTPDMQDEGFIRLTTHNHFADTLNSARLQRLKSPEHKFTAQVQGNFPKSSYPADETLVLKLGAQVMFIKNDVGEFRRYYNGMIGKVTTLSDEKIGVTPLDDSEEIDVTQVSWENNKYEMDEASGMVKEVVDGTFSQIPLRLAWSITIHKSQGLTFDRAIIDAQRSFAPGQAYVALSRCRSLQGLYLNSILPASAIIIDADVNSFIDDCRENAPTDNVVQHYRDLYLQQVLIEVFNFMPIFNAFEAFMRTILEFVAPIHNNLFSDYRNHENLLRNKIADVGTRFAKGYAGTTVQELEADSRVQDKIKGGCAYFIREIEPIIELVNNTPTNIDNKKYLSQIASAKENLSDLLSAKIFLLTELQDAVFTPQNYLTIKAKAMIRIDKGESIFNSRSTKKTKTKKNIIDIDSITGNNESATDAKPKKEKREKSEKKPKGYSKFETLKLFNDGMSIDEIAAHRGLVASTISSHLSDLIQGNHLQLEAIISAAELNILVAEYKNFSRQLEEQKQDETYAGFMERIGSRVEPYKSIIFWRMRTALCEKK